MRKYNYIVSVIMILIGGYVIFETSGYSVGTNWQKNPAIWPRSLAIMLIGLSIGLIIQTIFSKDPEMDRKDVINWKSPGMIRAYVMIGFAIVYVILMHFVGMLLALLIIIPCAELLMGCKNKFMLIVYPIGLVAFCYFFFVVVMKITLPQPIWA